MTQGVRGFTLKAPETQLAVCVAGGLTQWVGFAILVWDGEHTNDGMTILSQLLVDLLSKQTLTNHCNLHPVRVLEPKRRNSVNFSM